MPESGFIHTVHHAKRNLKEAEAFLGKLKGKSDGKAPLFLSDAWFYEEALYNVYCHFEKQPYQGKGRPRLPVRIIDADLKYAQVYKKRDDRGKIESISTRIVIGQEEQIMDIIQKGGRSKTINTSFVESRNGKYRKDNVRLNRKTMCHSKKTKYHDSYIDFLTVVFNFCRENDALKEVENPDAPLFKPKYIRKSPAMVENLTNKILTVKELLCIRVPIKNIL